MMMMMLMMMMGEMAIMFSSDDVADDGERYSVLCFRCSWSLRSASRVAAAGHVPKTAYDMVFCSLVLCYWRVSSVHCDAALFACALQLCGVTSLSEALYHAGE